MSKAASQFRSESYPLSAWNYQPTKLRPSFLDFSKSDGGMSVSATLLGVITAERVICRFSTAKTCNFRCDFTRGACNLRLLSLR